MPPERKVLLLTWYLHIGGLERMLLNLATELKARGEWAPQVFALDRRPDAGPENDLSPAFAAAGVPVTAFRKRPGFSPSAVLALRRKLRDEDVRVLHTHDLGALIYGACVKLLSPGRVRLVHTQHSFVHLDGRRVYRLYQRLFVRLADAVTVVSDDTAASYAALGVAPDAVRVIPNGVRFPQRSVADAAGRGRLKDALLESLDAPARAALTPLRGAFWILYMARIDSTKGQDRALELWARMSPAARAACALLFVGPESEAGTLKKLQDAIARSPDSARLLVLGATHRPERWLACADAGLSCSQFEGMPLGPIEAAGAGLPLVLSRIAGHALLKDCSAQYPPEEPERGARLLEAELAQAASDPEGRLRGAWERAREIRERFTMARMGAEYARAYSAEAA